MLADFRVTEDLVSAPRWRLSRARRVQNGQPVLLKFLTARPNQPEAQVAAFQHEYSILSRLHSCHTVHPLDFVHESGESVMVLADFDGESLETILRIGRLAPETFLPVAIALAQMLAEIHAEDLILTNLTPAGLLVNRAENTVCLAECSTIVSDLGVAQPPRLHDMDWAYISPEMTGRLNRGIDSRTDLYSLGMILYSMLVGELPFHASDSLEWVHCHIARTPRHPMEVLPGLPEILAEIVMKLLSKSPDDRYQTARGLQFDLEQCMVPGGGHSLASFPLAQRDASDRFQIPQRLYGRTTEVQTLLRAFGETADSGWPSHIIVSGYPGIGKTHLVMELARPILNRNGYFIAGKFNQFAVAMPYATIAEAFQELVRQILGENEAAVEAWRYRFLDALGQNGQLVIDLVPQMELIIGSQPALPSLPPLEESNRFLRVFGQFLSVVARPEHPLVVFLDDLQWADPGSLTFLEHVLTNPETSHIMVITAYRDQEINAFSSLARTLAAIRKRLPPLEIHLGPLDASALRHLVSDTLHCPIEECSRLAELISLKTGGNPFFVNQFLRMLHQEGWIFFDSGSGAWKWDMDRIEASNVTDNVVDLMSEKIKRLDDAVQPLLRVAACLGSRFDSTTLSGILKLSEADVINTLSLAVRDGLLLLPVSALGVNEPSVENPLHTEYRWPHDRVQQAAYMLIPREERNREHLRIGRALLAGVSEDRLEESIFDLCNQLNHGVAFITDPEEKRSLCRLNILAGEKARKAIAYASARDYLAMAVALLEGDAWTQNYDRTFRLFLDLSECHYLSGNIDEADQLFSEILEKARSNVDKARVYSLRIRLFEAAGRYGDGATVGLLALSLFNITFPTDPAELVPMFLQEHQRVQEALKQRPIPSLDLAPEATDPEVRMAIALLAETIASVYNANPPLLPLIITRGLWMSMEHGITSDSCLLFSFYGILLTGIFRDIPSAYDFSLLSLHLNDRFEDFRPRGTLLYIHAAFVQHWKNHIGTNRAIMEEAFVASVNAGDYVFAGFNRNDLVWQAFEQGVVIDDILTLSLSCAAFTKQTHNDMQNRLIGFQQQFLLCLKGQRTDPFAFDTPEVSEEACLQSFVSVNFGCGLGFFHIMKQILMFLSGRFDEALAEAEKTRPLLPAVMGLCIEGSHFFYSSLTLTATIPHCDPARRDEYRKWLDENMSLLKLWSEQCPENFAHRYALVQAELARMEGRDMDAEHLYEKAIRSAHENGFLQNEAIANELAARFFEKRGFERIATTYARDARSCFSRWGSGLKRHANGGETALSLQTVESDSDQPDFLSIAKVSQAISSEILLDRLLDTLMRVVLENAGAQIGFLFNIHRDGWTMAADARVEQQEIRVTVASERSTMEPLLPESIINYVRRSGERVILADATRPNPFSSDQYVATVQPRSVLCLPIMKQGRLVGILYLENNAATNAFTPERLTVLEMISSQAAISIENARLYSDLKRENTERRLAEEHIRHMAHHDALTGLPNRMLFRDRVEQSISQAHRQGGLVAVLFIDLDHFKDINDSLGHQLGDHLLQQTGLRLQRCLREGDTVARLGGDEFIFCLPGLRREDEAILVAERILETLRKTFHLERYQLHVTGSIGISLYPHDAEDVDGLMRAADAAMYHAKGNGRDNFRFFTSELNEAAHRRLSMANQLYQALDQRKFAVYYQPQIHLETGRILSAEALVRLEQPEGEPLLPGEFISVAEETGLIVPLGEWVLEEACMQLELWRSQGHPDLRISVNLSPRQFRNPGFPGRAASILRQRGVPPGALDLEITEGVLMTQNRENISALEELANMGVRLAIDDFGTGYSSLSYLQRFPIDTLKIDQSFIRGLQRDANDTAIVNTIIAMANTLELNVIAEGVETEGQVHFLKNNGCQAAQGFYYSRPIPAVAFTRLLNTWE